MSVTVINTGYVSAVARKRSESNMARAGARSVGCSAVCVAVPVHVSMHACTCHGLVGPLLDACLDGYLPTLPTCPPPHIHIHTNTHTGVPRILSGYRDKALPQLNTDLRALLLGGWDQRAGDFSNAVAAMQAKLGGECLYVYV